jgi:hypothetical protein
MICREEGKRPAAGTFGPGVESLSLVVGTVGGRTSEDGQDD